MSNKIGESSEDKKIFGTIFSRKPSLRDDKWCRRIFFYLLKYGPSRPTKIEDYFEKEYEDVGIKKINVRRTISEKLLKHNIVVKVPTESDAVLYDLSEEFKAITFDQWRHFEKMREVFEPHLWGYLGRGGMNEFMANHTTYGFPTPNELSNYERDMALMAMKMIDTGFRSLQEVKFLTEIKKELAEQNNSEGELPENLFSFRLTLEYMTFFVSRYLKKMAHHSDNPDEFFEKVKDASLKILQEEKENTAGDDALEDYEDRSHSYQQAMQDKNQCIEEIFPEMKDFGNTLNIAVLSTKGLLFTEEHRENIEAVLDRVLTQKPIDWQSDDLKIRIKAMEYILREIWRVKLIDQWKQHKQIKLKFIHHEKLNDYFDGEEIQAMADSIDYYVNKNLKVLEQQTGESILLSELKKKFWQEPFHPFDVLYYVLVYHLFKKDGAYHDEWAEKEIENRISRAKKPSYEWVKSKKKELVETYEDSQLKSDKLWQLKEYLESKVFIEKILQNYLPQY